MNVKEKPLFFVEITAIPFEAITLLKAQRHGCIPIPNRKVDLEMSTLRKTLFALKKVVVIPIQRCSIMTIEMEMALFEICVEG